MFPMILRDNSHCDWLLIPAERCGGSARRGWISTSERAVLRLDPLSGCPRAFHANDANAKPGMGKCRKETQKNKVAFRDLELTGHLPQFTK
jgi:hypothetical protein